MQHGAEDVGGSPGAAATAAAGEPAAAAAPTAEPATAAPAAEPAAAETATGGGLIVEDETTELGSGQMRKTQFLDQLRAEVCAAADAELAAVGRSTEGCPYVERWINHYRTRPAQYVERALRRYAPDAVGVTSAAGYIPLVAARVRRAVTVWATTGELTGVPDDLAAELTGGGVLGALGGGVAAVASAAAGAFGGIGSAIGGLFTKAKEGGARAGDDPQEIQSQLSSGQSLEGNVKSRMENAFGHDFSRVRVHSDSRAAGLSASVNARAFTIGHDVAFGAGEYKPNTLIGDALIAHELAHVVQQGSAAPGAGPQMQGGEYNGLEEDADRAAVSAVVSSWGGANAGLAGVSEQAMPRLRSGLRLSRCSRTVEHPCTTRTAPVTPVKTVTVRHSHLFEGKSSGTFATELTYANTVYRLAGINFTSGHEELIDETATKAAGLLGSNALLAYAGPSSTASTYTAEENALLAHNDTAGEITVYYIKGVENRTDLAGRAYLDREAVIDLADAPQRTLPHEMGHLLIGAIHPNNNDNIMAQSSVASGVDCLSDEEIRLARANSLAT